MRLNARLGSNKFLLDALTFPAAARRAWRHAGAAGAWVELRQRTLDRVYVRSRLLVIEQDLDGATDVPPPSGVTIRRAGSGDIERLATLASPLTMARLRRAASRGRTCLVALRGGRPVGYTWISARLDPDLERYPLPLPPNAAYLWDLYVVPEERDRGIGSALVSARLRHARVAGFRVGWRAIEDGNLASLRTLARTGGRSARVVGELSVEKILRRVRARFHLAEGLPAVLGR